MKTLYEILGVPVNASSIVIKEAFKKLAMEHHPDKGGDADEFILVQQAYEILSDIKSRKEYDLTGHIPNINEEAMIISKAKNNLIQALRGMISSQQFLRNSDSFDIISTMSTCIVDNKNGIQNILKDKNKQLKLIEKVLKKLIKKTKTESSFLHDSLNSMILDTQNEIKSINLDIKVLDIMSELIKEYSYDTNMDIYSMFNTLNRNPTTSTSPIFSLNSWTSS